MRSYSIHSPVRAFLAVALMVSWLVLSNHCALGLMAAGDSMEEHVDCCGTHSAGESKSSQPVRECCASVGALLADPPTLLATPNWVMLVLTPVPAAEKVSVSQAWREWIEGWCFETGPPGWRGFAELVLQRSLLAHAPPRSV